VKLALGEHVPNRVVFKNFLPAGGAGFIPVDAGRVAGVRVFLSAICSARNSDF
jgi:L-fuconate dehydratase